MIDGAQHRQIAIVPYVSSRDLTNAQSVGRAIVTALPTPGTTAIFWRTTRPLNDTMHGMACAGGRSLLVAASSADNDRACYDAVLVESDRKLSFDMVVRSSRGVLALPTTDAAGLTPDELTACARPVAYLTEESTVLQEFPTPTLRGIFDAGRGAQAVSWLFGTPSKDEHVTVDQLLKTADAIHNSCYPLGERGEYRDSAVNYEAAVALMRSDMGQARSKALASYYDALGDHCYYHEEDYLRAASYYDRSRRLSAEIERQGQQEAREVLLFLRAITVESIALAFAQAGDFGIARTLTLEAAKRYASAGHFAAPKTMDCYRHTVAGLHGWADLLEAKQTAALGDDRLARLLLDAAKDEYAEALKRQPLWAKSGFSDAYCKTEAELRDAERRIGDSARQPNG